MVDSVETLWEVHLIVTPMNPLNLPNSLIPLHTDLALVLSTTLYRDESTLECSNHRASLGRNLSQCWRI